MVRIARAREAERTTDGRRSDTLFDLASLPFFVCVTCVEQASVPVSCDIKPASSSPYHKLVGLELNRGGRRREVCGVRRNTGDDGASIQVYLAQR
jgi:hypothetical protein